MRQYQWRYSKDVAWWKIFKWDKPLKTTFYSRLASWYTKEQAILMWEDWLNVLSQKNINRVKKYIPKYSNFYEEKKNINVDGINITYSVDVANVFKKEFARIINKIEDMIYWLDDEDCIKELNKKLMFVKEQQDIFISYNP